MSLPAHAVFEGIVTEILRRFFAQNERSAPESECLGVAARLAALMAERGLPPPLTAGDRGRPGSMSEPECAPLVARVLNGAADPLLADAVRQLVKACFYPEFTECRESFREVGKDGACRRQELARVRGRISGTHCVDCPYWVALSSDQHAAFVASEWKQGAECFAAHQAIYLPEDFRRFRRWLYAAMRQR